MGRGQKNMPSVRLTKRIKAFSQLVPMDSLVEFTVDMPWWKLPRLVAGDNHWGTEIIWRMGTLDADSQLCVQWLWAPPTETLTDHSLLQSYALNVTRKQWPKIF